MNQQIRDSFYMTLKSDQTPFYYPSNTSWDFRVKLGKTLKFPPKTFEVGLAQIFFTSRGPKKDKDGKPISRKKKFFGHVDKDDEISITRHSDTGFIVKKTYDDLDLFIKLLNRKIQEKKFDIIFVLDRKGDDTHIDVINSMGDKYELVIPQELAHALGYTYREFKNGKHHGSMDYSPSHFLAFESDKQFEIQLITKADSPVKVTEPKKYDKNYLVASINETLKSYNASLSYNGAEIVYKSTDMYMFVALSPQMYAPLGLDPQTIFNGKVMTVPVTENIILESETDLMLILISCVEEQVFGSLFIPLLKTLSQPPEERKDYEMTFSPIQYVALEETSLDQVRIQIVDEHLIPLPFANKPSTLTLHFRTRPL